MIRPLTLSALVTLAACAQQPDLSAALSRCDDMAVEAAASTHSGVRTRLLENERDCRNAVRSVIQRQARYRALAMDEPFPVAPVYVPPSYSVVQPVPMPQKIAPAPYDPMLPVLVSPPVPPQTWGQTRCAPAIAPVMWDAPVTERNGLIPAGC